MLNVSEKSATWRILEDLGWLGLRKNKTKKIMPVYVNIGILFGEKNINNLE